MSDARTYELWIVGSQPKITMGNMTRAEAIAVYAEFIRQYKQEGWTDMDEQRKPPALLSKLERGHELTVVGVIDTAEPKMQPIPHWLTRIPVVSYE